jgi:spectinomycin phosphotransferase
MDDRGREIGALVEQGWGIAAATVRRHTGGLDPNASAYDLTADDGTRYFVKLRTVPAAVAVPQYLRRQGITAVVAPLDTADGRPFLTADETQILLYPFVDGRDCWAAGFTDDQYVEYGRILAAVHAAGTPPGVPEETFDPPSIPLLRSLADRVGENRDLTEVWRAHTGHIQLFLDRAEELRTATDGTNLVLCHGDIHTGNVLARPGGALSIVDWDAPVRAPRERDLVFLLAGPWGEQPATERRKALFYQGYGRYEVHRPTLDYYHVERIVDDIGQFALTVLDPHGDGEAKRTALYWLRRNLGEAAAHPK